MKEFFLSSKGLPKELKQNHTMHGKVFFPFVCEFSFFYQWQGGKSLKTMGKFI